MDDDTKDVLRKGRLLITGFREFVRKTIDGVERGEIDKETAITNIGDTATCLIEKFTVYVKKEISKEKEVDNNV